MEYNQDCVVIIDEAYFDFGDIQARNSLSKYENLIVTGSFSKSRSLAGMRIGYALGSKELYRRA
jgi:histidinol-phosphate aminotransferase